jgi:hypothetical protein
MSMLTLNGMVLNVFDTPPGVDKKTGAAIPPATRVQVQAENTLPNGQKRIELVTLKVTNGDAYRNLVGRPVRVPVGCFASGQAVVFYALKDDGNSVEN